MLRPVIPAGFRPHSAEQCSRPDAALSLWWWGGFGVETIGTGRPVTVLKQAAAVLAGLLAAAIMVGLGMWQLSKYQAQGMDQIRHRAAGAPVALHHVAEPGHDAKQDAFYRRVRFSGHYDNSSQRLLPTGSDSGKSRVVTAFILDNGGAVPVVRGTTHERSAPAAPSNRMHQTGTLLPSENSDSPDHSGERTPINLSALAQDWKSPLIGGFVTIGADEAHAQSLTPAPVQLPRTSGRFQNGAYALQWWVFAAFALAMAVKTARDIGVRASLDDPDEPDLANRQGAATAHVEDGEPTEFSDGEGPPSPSDNRPPPTSGR